MTVGLFTVNDHLGFHLFSLSYVEVNACYGCVHKLAQSNPVSYAQIP